jgi:hypothetical protein
MTRMVQCEQGIVAVLDWTRAMGEARATRFGGVMRGGRSLEITKPWPDREFAGISWMWRDNDVAPDVAPCGAGGRGWRRQGRSRHCLMSDLSHFLEAASDIVILFRHGLK